MKTIITWNVSDGLKIERPHKQPFTLDQRFYIRMARYALLGFVLVALALLRMCEFI